MAAVTIFEAVRPPYLLSDVVGELNCVSVVLRQAARLAELDCDELSVAAGMLGETVEAMQRLAAVADVLARMASR